MNHTLIEHAHSIMLQTGMSEGLWVEVASYACYLVNSSSFTAVKLQIPDEIW